MFISKQIGWLSFLLAFTAGFCDATTFTAANELFSAHVTGNFIVFAYDLVKKADSHTWLKLISMPVFIISVLFAGWIGRKLLNMNVLLFWEGGFLLLAGCMALIVLKGHPTDLPERNNTIAMLIVFAMGIQNAFGRIFVKATYAPTTVMTGNVTQVTLDLVNMVLSRPFDPEKWGSCKKQLLVIVAFLTGCVLGGILAGAYGLGVVIIPGAAITILFWKAGFLKYKAANTL